MVNLTYYTTTLDKNIPIPKRELWLRYMEGCRLTDIETIDVLRLILVALTEQPTNFQTKEELEIAIELYILDHPAKPVNYSEAEDEIVREMKAEGAGNVEIAERLGRSKGSVNARWAKIK